MGRIYIYRGYRDAAFAAADRRLVIDCFGSEETFSHFFGGEARYGGWLRPSLLGVWGARNVARLRRLLRERVGDLEIVHSAPPSRHTGTSISGVRLGRLERDALERAIKRGWPAPATNGPAPD